MAALRSIANQKFSIGDVFLERGRSALGRRSFFISSVAIYDFLSISRWPDFLGFLLLSYYTGNGMERSLRFAIFEKYTMLTALPGMILLRSFTGKMVDQVAGKFPITEFYSI